MNISSNRLFPHPVLWFVNDDYSNSEFAFRIEVESDPERLSLNYNIALKNTGIQKLIEEGKAIFCIHIESPLTMYRYNHLTKSESGKIGLNGEDINHRLEILPMVVALENIDCFSNQELNEDYHGTDIKVTKGSVIAISDFHYLNIDKEINDLGRKESIFSIVKASGDGPMLIDVMQDRIIIKLNETDFKNFQILQMNSGFRSIIFSLIIIPALIYALDNIGDISNSNEGGDINDYKWFRSLEKVFLKHELTLDANTISNKTSYALAQMLLDHPISDALIALTERGS